MQITNAVFLTSVATLEQCSAFCREHDAPQICVVGRSNVGKSSFINSLTGRPKLAKTSATPGRTRLINCFDINGGAFILVDLPGYGYAAAPKSEKEKWGALIEGYLSGSGRLKHVLALTDIRHDPTALDRTMLGYLYHYALPFTVVATKSDKLSHAQVGRARAQTASVLSLGRDDVLPYSSVSGQGKAEILTKIETVLG